MAFTDDAFLQAAGLSLAAYSATPLPTGETGWTPVTAADLGLRPLGTADEGTYRMTPGVYTQTQGLSSAAAHVYLNEDDGTLAIAFRGTDEALDLRDHADLTTHYARFEPLMDAIADLMDARNSPVEQVLVTGHSLGGAMATTAMIDQGWTNDPRVLGIAIGGHGTEPEVAALAPARVVNLINVLHEDDRLLLSEEPAAAGLSWLTRAGAGRDAPTEQVGVEVWIDELPNPDVTAGLILGTQTFTVPRQAVGAHELEEYAADIQVLHGAGVLDPGVLAARQEWQFTINPRTNDLARPGEGTQPRYLDLLRLGDEVFTPRLNDAVADAREDALAILAGLRTTPDDIMDLFG